MNRTADRTSMPRVYDITYDSPCRRVAQSRPIGGAAGPPQQASQSMQPTADELVRRSFKPSVSVILAVWQQSPRYLPVRTTATIVGSHGTAAEVLCRHRRNADRAYLCGLRVPDPRSECQFLSWLRIKLSRRAIRQGKDQLVRLDLVDKRPAQ